MELVEYIYQHGETYARHYLLALKTNNTYEFLSIDGTSPCIYEAWRQRKFELTHDEQVKDYFKFFCWAIASTEGQFLMVDDYRMLPLTGKPQEISFSELRDLKYDITLDETSSVNELGELNQEGK